MQETTAVSTFGRNNLYTTLKVKQSKQIKDINFTKNN